MVYSISNKLKFIESIFGTGILASNSKNFDVRCPFCAPTNITKKKLAIKVENDMAHCWTCGWKGYTLAPLIKKFGTQEQFIRYRDEYMPEDVRRKYDNTPDEDNEKKSVTLPHDFCLLPLADIDDPNVKSAWNYLNERGITLNDAWYFKLGISNEPRWRYRIIVPSFDSNGKLNYFIARNISKLDRRPKYDNPDEDKMSIIFNEINIDWSKRLVVCEGSFDLMKCGDNAVTILGSDLNEQSRLFTQILLNNTPIALALDGNMWHKKTPKIVKRLQEYNVDVIVVDTRFAEDPGQMTKEQFKEALSIAKTPTWESSFLEKLEKASEINLRLAREQPQIQSHSIYHERQ